MKDALPGAVQTFITLDFFNHDTKHTDMTTGYEPEVNTIFSFKNNIDNFYLKFLDQEYIEAELFLVRGMGGAGKHSVKIGDAKLPLNPVLKHDVNLQVMSFTCCFGEWAGRAAGKVYYKYRMRKKLEEAIKWQNIRADVQNKQYDEQDLRELRHGLKSASTKPSVVSKKIFEITVKACHKLQRSDPNLRGTMRPFFSYDFYKFEFRSATASGADPPFHATKHYQVESTKELHDYMEKQFLKIDFIDEAVDMDAFKQNEMADYIGSVRFPLKTMLQQTQYEGLCPIINMENQKMGTAEIILKYVDADSPEAVVHIRDDREDAFKSQIIQKNVRMLIVRTLAEFDFEHVDTMLDTLFVEDKMDREGQVSIDTFK